MYQNVLVRATDIGGCFMMLVFHNTAWICLCIRPLFDLQQLKICRRGLWRCVLQIHAPGIQMMSEAHGGTVFFPGIEHDPFWGYGPTGKVISRLHTYMKFLKLPACLFAGSSG